MKAKLIAATAALVLGLAVGGTASAQSGAIPNGGLTVSDVQRFLQSKGYKAEIKKLDSGASYVESASSGIIFDVYMYDCNNGPRCASVQFHSGFDLTTALTAPKINEWNRDKRYLKAYIDGDGDPIVTYDVNVSPGKTYEGLADDFGVWTNILGEFTRFINW